MKQKEIGYFDVLKSVITKEDIPKELILKHFSPFLVIKWLSYDFKSCYNINSLNSAKGLNLIPKEVEYLFLKRTINLPKKTFIPFDKNNKDFSYIIKYLSIYFKTGKNTTIEYMKILKAKRIIELLEKLAMLDNKYITDKNIIDLRKAINSQKINIQKDFK